MFTLRQVEASGHESLREVKMVWRENDKRTLYATVDGLLDPLQFDCGEVYVMNAAGKTVAVYNLDAAN